MQKRLKFHDGEQYSVCEMQLNYASYYGANNYRIG